MNPPPMPLAPPSVRHAPDRDVGQLRVLAVCHFICAALVSLGLLLVGMHYALMYSLIAEGLKRGGSQSKLEIAYIEDPIGMMQWSYVPLLLLMGLSAACNSLSGVFLLKRRRRAFSLFTAAKNCLQFPFGTALGVCTFVVLNRPSVREKYAGAQRRLAP